MSLWPVLLLSKTRPARIKRSAVCIAAIGGVFFAGDVALYNIAVLHTSAENATFLSNNAPMFVGLLSWTVTRKMPSRMFWMALAIALSGSFLIVVVDAKNINPASSADELAVAASVCFALYLMATERLRGTCESLMLLTLSTTASAGALLIAAVLTHVSLRIPDTSSFASLLGLALICQIAGYFSLTSDVTRF
jgi:drug/metabolite transporter (DMT)-like permease